MTASDLVDIARLERWLSGRLPGLTTIKGVTKTATGQSNPTFILDTDAGRLVLRRKPLGKLLKSAHAVEREFRVMQALERTPVPVPRMIALCEDPEVIGSTFFVMEHVTGRTENDPRCLDLTGEVRATLYDRMNASLAALHQVQADAVGLSDFGRPDGYFERQLTRWTDQYRASQTEDRPDMDRLIDWLEGNLVPDDGRTALVHGDWRLDNLLFNPASGDVVAVLDWELSTRGHPLADLAAQIMQWHMPVGQEGRGLAGVDRLALGLPSDDAYVRAYAQRMGWSDVPDMRFPIAFAFFRMAAILEGVRRRALDGNASNPESGLKMSAQIPLLVARALDLINAEA